MKKLKFLALLLTLIMIVGALASCKNNKEPEDIIEDQPPVTIADFLNTDYEEKPSDIINSLAKVSDLDGYIIFSTSHSYHTDYYYNDEIALFVKTDDMGLNTYKLFSFRQGKVVKTFNETNYDQGNIQFSFEMYSLDCDEDYSYRSKDIPILGVIKGENRKSDVYYLIDASGNEIVKRSTSYINDEPYFVNDWLVFENDIFELDESTGAYTKNSKIPANLDIEIIEFKNDKYFYGEGRGDAELCVYDHNFNAVATYTLPSNTEERAFFILNDGNIFVQYAKVLDPYATEYDYYEGNSLNEIVKYDLVSEIFSIETKTSTTVDIGYAIEYGFSYDMLKEMQQMLLSEKEGMIAEGKFDNIVMVAPIKDKKICDNDAELDVLFMANDGTLGRSLKITEYQTGLHEKVADGIYKVSTLYGYALVDVEGKVLAQITNNNFEYSAGYFVNGYGIYDLSFNLVYDFSDNNARCMKVSDSAIFVNESEENNPENYKVYKFSNGEKKEIFTYKADEENHNYFYLEDNYYCIYSEKDNAYKYYNFLGVELMSGDIDLTYTNSYTSEEYSCSLILAEIYDNFDYKNIWYLAK